MNEINTAIRLIDRDVTNVTKSTLTKINFLLIKNVRVEQVYKNLYYNYSLIG